MIKQAKLSEKCQVTIPKQIRDFLKLKSGDSIIFYIENKQVKLTAETNINVKLKDNKNNAGITKGEE